MHTYAKAARAHQGQAVNHRSGAPPARKTHDTVKDRPGVHRLKDYQLTFEGRPEASAVKASGGPNGCIQCMFTLDGGPMRRRHLGPVERWVGKYHPGFVEEFLAIRDGRDPVDIDGWLNQHFNESYGTIDRADDAMEDALAIEAMEDDVFGGPGPPTVRLAYGEESGRGALAELRRDPSLARRGNRLIATTPGATFPTDADSTRARRELEMRGGETRTGVDVQESPLNEESRLPYNTTDVAFRYPRTPRGSNPSTATVVESFVKRVEETGRGDLSIPTPQMYGGRAATRNSLYGSSRFGAAMTSGELGISEVRPGPEEELGPFGYSHRMTDRPDERPGGVQGKTLVIERGGGPTAMDTGDDD